MNKLIITFDSVLGTVWSCWANKFSALVHSVLGIERKTDVQVFQISAQHVWKLFGIFVCKQVKIQKQQTRNFILWNFTRYGQNLSVLITIGQTQRKIHLKAYMHLYVVYKGLVSISHERQRKLWLHINYRHLIAIFSRSAFRRRDGTSDQDITDDMNTILNSLVTHYPLFGGTFWANAGVVK